MRLRGVPIGGHIDDFFTKSKSYESCLSNIYEMIREFQFLGFAIHPVKSEFDRKSQEITFLGFVLNSREMTVSLPVEKEINFELWWLNYYPSKTQPLVL